MIEEEYGSSVKASMWVSLMAICALGVLVVGGCGGGSKSSSESDTGQTPATTSAPEQAASGGTEVVSASAERGKELFKQTCATCHGPEGKGLPKLGKDLTTSAFAKEKTDQELVEFIKIGRPASHPLNTTKVDMPPKGGNPALTDEDMLSIAKFVHTLVH